MTSPTPDDETTPADDDVLTTPATPGAEALPTTDPADADSEAAEGSGE